MSKVWLVAWGQIKRIALHWSFLIIVCYPPLLVLFFGAYAVFVGWASGLQSTETSAPAPGVVITNNVAFDQPVGLVDLAGLIQNRPADLAPSQLLTFATEAQAQAATQTGQISGYYLIPADYLTNGQVTYLSPDNVQFTQTDEVIKRLLTFNLAQADGDQVARRVIEPVQFNQRLITLTNLPANALQPYTPAEVGIGVGIALFVYFTIGSVCGTFLNQLAHEREGRVLEVVLNAITPLQLLTGKFIGILVVGLVETGTWLFWVRLFGAAGSQLSGALGLASNTGSSTGTDLSVFILSGLVYIGGYIAYAATSAVFGALVKDGGQASRINFALVLVALAPLIWLISVLSDRNGTLAVALSLFPLTAPIILPLRLFITQVPLWQVLTSFTILLGWTAFMLWLAAQLFQARLLLSDVPLRQLLWHRLAMGKTQNS